jgi:hypothetical protein
MKTSFLKRESRAQYNGDKPPTVKSSIARIEESGEWKFQYYNSPWYVFRSNSRGEVTFTLAELRHAAYFGW